MKHFDFLLLNDQLDQHDGNFFVPSEHLFLHKIPANYRPE